MSKKNSVLAAHGANLNCTSLINIQVNKKITSGQTSRFQSFNKRQNSVSSQRKNILNLCKTSDILFRDFVQSKSYFRQVNNFTKYKPLP